MCATTSAPVQLPVLRKWQTASVGGFTNEGTQQHLVPGLGALSIVPVRPDGVAVTGWALRVALTLPYGVSAKPYQLTQTADVKGGAARMYKAAVAFANDKAAQFKAKQAVLAAASVQHV